MGSLKDVVIRRESIDTGGGEFTVGPLSVAHILALFFSHRSQVENLFDSFKTGASTEQDIFLELVVTLPELVAEIIARGAGEADDLAIAKARQLDIGTQLIALEKIGLLTVESVGGLGNLASLIERLSGNVSKAMALRGSPLPNGSAVSEDNARSSSPQDTPTPTTTPSG
jgi:hypothetical protein